MLLRITDIIHKGNRLIKVDGLSKCKGCVFNNSSDTCIDILIACGGGDGIVIKYSYIDIKRLYERN